MLFGAQYASPGGILGRGTSINAARDIDVPPGHPECLDSGNEDGTHLVLSLNDREGALCKRSDAVC